MRPPRLAPRVPGCNRPLRYADTYGLRRYSFRAIALRRTLDTIPRGMEDGETDAHEY